MFFIRTRFSLTSEPLLHFFSFSFLSVLFSIVPKLLRLISIDILKDFFLFINMGKETLNVKGTSLGLFFAINRNGNHHSLK